MATRWSERILIANLRDEPDLSEELLSILETVEAEPTGLASSVALDMRDVTYCNSSNIAQLLRLNEAVKRRGARLALCCLRDSVWSLFVSTNLDRVLEVAPTKAAALATLQLSEAAKPEVD